MSHKERLIELRASKYFYEDIKIHSLIDLWEKVELEDFEIKNWESASNLTKSIYKAFAKDQLIKEGVIKD